MRRLIRRLLGVGERWSWNVRRVRFRLGILPQVWAGRLRLAEDCGFDAPLRCDGLGEVSLGTGVLVGYRLAPRSGNGEVQLQARYPGSVVTVGEGSVLGNNTAVIAVQRVAIGDGCLIGDHVLILDSDFHHADPANRNAPNPPTAEVVIGDNVWLGSRVLVLKGVTIGRNSVIAAGAVVTVSIPENPLAAGVPARVLRPL